MPLAPSKWLSKWLSRWIKVNKWHYFHFCSQDFFFLSSISIFFYFFEYETISLVRRSAWSFGHSVPDPSSVQRFIWWKLIEHIQLELSTKPKNYTTLTYFYLNNFERSEWKFQNKFLSKICIRIFYLWYVFMLIPKFQVNVRSQTIGPIQTCLLLFFISAFFYCKTMVCTANITSYSEMCRQHSNFNFLRANLLLRLFSIKTF